MMIWIFPRCFIVILTFTANILCIENVLKNTEAESKYNKGNSVRQSHNGLLKFKDQPNPDKINFEGDKDESFKLISFKDQPVRKPFRFEDVSANEENQEYDFRPHYQKHETSTAKIRGFKFEDTAVQTDQEIENKEPDYQNFVTVPPNLQLLENQNHGLTANDKPGYGLTFQDNNNLEPNQGAPGLKKKRKRRRRRRRPRFQQLPGQGYGFGAAPQGLPEYPNPGYPYPGLPGPVPAGQYYRPQRRPRPSIAEEALTSITEALTSIARYDDYQCVPRLLCEVAGGKTPSASEGSGFLQTVVNLQPLITLLAAYNGLSTSPLFVFGRAAILGMTSKGNSGTCRYAYPLCPTDPEKLVEYLNTHNGGFFRFFNNPLQNPGSFDQQNLQQFYNHLSPEQGYGFQQPNIPGSMNGFQNPALVQPGYGLYPNEINQNYGYQNQQQQFGYGLQNQPSIQNPGLYNNFNGFNMNYGYGFPYHQNYQNSFPDYSRYKNNADKGSQGNSIEKRIQNRPDIIYVDNSFEEPKNVVKWFFPNIATTGKDTLRFGRTIKFPGTDNLVPADTYRKDGDSEKAKGFQFPENQSNRKYVDYYNYPPYTDILHTHNFKLNKNGFYVEDSVGNGVDEKANREEGVEIVYVLRGNGDPNHPEVVKLRPGQKIV